MPPEPTAGSWTYAQELYDRSDPEFVTEIRRLTDAERLGTFAARWYGDPRPEARRLLLAYLDLPLNAYRHEPLVKRLFKLAEAAGDDVLLARFLVLLDRSVRRRKVHRRYTRSVTFSTREEAEAQARRWHDLGFAAEVYASTRWRGPFRGMVPEFCAYYRGEEDVLRLPDGTTMPRPLDTRRPAPPPTAWGTPLESKRLFTVRTRHYLRRRAWRYFRNLARQKPERYVAAAVEALRCYRDEDTANGVALLDNWGLVHVLFHDCPVLVAGKRGWSLRPGHRLAELAPAPAFPDLWREKPRGLVDVLKDGRCRAVRQWAVRMLRAGHILLLRELTPDERFALLAADDPVVAELAAELLRQGGDLAALGVDRLLELAEKPGATLEIVCELLRDRLGPDRVAVAQAARLAAAQAIPAARLGFAWLQTKPIQTADDCRALLALAEARAEPIRPELIRWARGVLGRSLHFEPAWALEFLDSRHADVRAEGWAWLQADERIRHDVALWPRLLETPYDDVRLGIVGELERVAMGRSAAALASGKLDAALLRCLWASVLLNARRGGRVKPFAVGQVVRRLAARPEEAPQLLPILAVALRSVRGPEWRAGLVGIVDLVRHRPDLGPRVSEHFPELRLNTEGE